MNKLSIKDWAEEDRPREKMVKKGTNALSNAELIAILIGSGNNEESAVQLSQRILHSVKNNLNTLGKLSIKELINSFKGIGEAKAITILAALELGKRHGSSDILQCKKIQSSHAAFQLFYPLVGDIPHEEIWIAFMNHRSEVLNYTKISQGGISGTAIDIRIILKSALNYLASGIILCHNHPSGNIRPSIQDDQITQKLRDSAALMEIKFLDHIVISGKKYYSYADEGRIL